jgi:hypothetical protein
MEFHSSFNNKKAQRWKLAKEINCGQSSVQCTPTWIFLVIKSFIETDVQLQSKAKSFSTGLIANKIKL